MADPQSNARLRADAGAPTSGVIHVRTRLTADFTVISNALAQRRGSAVAVGVAVYILPLPTGTPVTIAALCAHFTEGEILISRALRELEAAGYLERRRERLPSGRIRTRTYFHDVPGGTLHPGPDGPLDRRSRPRPGSRPRPSAPRPLRRPSRKRRPLPPRTGRRSRRHSPTRTRRRSPSWPPSAASIRVSSCPSGRPCVWHRPSPRGWRPVSPPPGSSRRSRPDFPNAS
ncbi:hypothetical protein SUDANB126_03286 [Streptomyces sp. enrichment culture]